MNPTRLVLQTVTIAALAGCSMGLRGMDFTVTFDGGTAQCEYWLHDVRVKRGGLARTLPDFVEVVKKEEEDLRQHDPPFTYRWVRYDGGVDARIAGAYPRDLFEACAREECDGGASPRCGADFPVKLCGDRYVADPKVPSLPADAGVLRWAIPVDKEEDDQSAAVLVAVFDRSRGAAEATARWMGAYDKAFTAGQADQVRKLAEEGAGVAAGSPELEEAIRETVLRHRQDLLWAYLDERGYKEALAEQTKETSFHQNKELLGLLPQKPLAEPLGLKLRIAYEVGRAGYLERQQHADAQAILAQVCGDKRARAKDAKRFCDLLLVEPRRTSP